MAPATAAERAAIVLIAHAEEDLRELLKARRVALPLEQGNPLLGRRKLLLQCGVFSLEVDHPGLAPGRSWPLRSRATLRRRLWFLCHRCTSFRVRPPDSATYGTDVCLRI